MPTDRRVEAMAILAALNRLLGISQEQIARDLAVSYSTVNGWVNGKRNPQPAGFKTLRSMAYTAVSRSARDRKAALAAFYLAAPSAIQTTSVVNPLDILLEFVLAKKTSSAEIKTLLLFLKAEFGDWSEIGKHSPQEIESKVRLAGFGSFKARTLVKLVNTIKRDQGSASLSSLKKWGVRRAEQYLLSLPGVDLLTARKTLFWGLNKDVFPADPDVYRTALRSGLVETSRSVTDMHSAFAELVEQLPEGAPRVYRSLKRIATDFCRPLNPLCGRCDVSTTCATYQQKVQPGPPLHGTKGAATAQAQLEIARRHVALPAAEETIVAVDLFAGCGGLSLGLARAGIDVRYAVDWDQHACGTHRNNFRDSIVECEDIRAITGTRIKRAIGAKVDLVAGGPNCQGVSERGLRAPEDPRNFMFPEFVRLVSELQPKFFIMENVPGLAHRHNFHLLRDIFSAFEGLGYRCAADVLLAAAYGVPQLRYRFFLIGTLLEQPLTFPMPTHTEGGDGTLFGHPFVTVSEAIGDLPIIHATRQIDGPLPYPENANLGEYQRLMRGRNDRVINHICSATQPINLRRAAHIPEGGNWKDIPAHLLPKRFYTCRMTDHSTTYARLRRDCPAYTITSLFGNITAGAFLHPQFNRALSIREGARLQSFPDAFEMLGPRNSQYRQIGNAVPPLLAEAVGSHLAALARGQNPPGLTPRIDASVLSSSARWDALPVLTPRFRQLFGNGTKWPKGWGRKPKQLSDRLDDNYSLREEYRSA